MLIKISKHFRPVHKYSLNNVSSLVQFSISGCLPKQTYKRASQTKHHQKSSKKKIKGRTQTKLSSKKGFHIFKPGSFVDEVSWQIEGWLRPRNALLMNFLIHSSWTSFYLIHEPNVVPRKHLLSAETRESNQIYGKGLVLGIKKVSKASLRFQVDLLKFFNNFGFLLNKVFEGFAKSFINFPKISFKNFAEKLFNWTDQIFCPQLLSMNALQCTKHFMLVKLRCHPTR